MLERIGSIAVDNSKDYKHETVSSLEKSGFTLILTLHTYGTDYYDIAKENKE